MEKSDTTHIDSNRKIEIRTLLSQWREVDRATAQTYVKHLTSHANGLRKEEKVPYIEKHKLRGITVDELLRGERDSKSAERAGQTSNDIAAVAGYQD